MKKIIIILFAAMTLQAGAQDQAFAKGDRLNSIGFGVSQYFHINTLYNTYNNTLYYGTLSYLSTTGEFNIESEKAVSDYVGVGMNLGIGGHATRLYGYGEANLTLGPVVNFHFYQLIANKTGKNIHADKLDIYAGINLGAGGALQVFNDNPVRFQILAYGGFQVGVRYYVSPRFAFNLETGYGKSIINGGITVKVFGRNKRG